MSQENVEIVKRAWEAWHRDDLDANLDALHPEVELHTAIERNFEGTGSVYRGHDGFRELWASYRSEAFQRLEVRWHEFRDNLTTIRHEDAFAGADIAHVLGQPVLQFTKTNRFHVLKCSSMKLHCQGGLASAACRDRPTHTASLTSNRRHRRSGDNSDLAAHGVTEDRERGRPAESCAGWYRTARMRRTTPL